MQWSYEDNAGFSSAPSKQLVRPLIKDGEYGYKKVNVEQQRYDPHSLLNRVERMIRLRKEHPEFGFGNCTIVDSAEPAVFAIQAEWEGNTTMAVHNVAERPACFRWRLSPADSKQLVDVFHGDRFAPRADGSVEIDLEPYGFRWLEVRHG